MSSHKSIMSSHKGIAIVNGGEKGGTGKTTMSVNLAIMLALSNKDVVLVDCDKQKSSFKYLNTRRELGISPNFSCIPLRGKHIYSEIEDLAKRYEYVIVDAGGQDSAELRSALTAKVVKKLISPFQTTEMDLETLERIDELASHSQLYNPGLKAYTILTRAPTNPMLNDMVLSSIETLNLIQSLTFAGVILFERVAFQYARSSGLSVVEYERKKITEMTKQQARTYIPKASIEICELFKEALGFSFDYETIFGVPLVAINDVKEAVA